MKPLSQRISNSRGHWIYYQTYQLVVSCKNQIFYQWHIIDTSCETQLVHFYHNIVQNLDGAHNQGFAPRQTYKILVWPKLEYVSSIWHPHVKTQIPVTQLEKVHRMAARCWLQDGSAGGGEIWVVWVKCWMIWIGHPWRCIGKSPHKPSVIRSVMIWVLCLLIKTHIWPPRHTVITTK